MEELRGSPQWTQSELENAFLSLIRDAGLPEPRCNVLVEGELVAASGRLARSWSSSTASASIAPVDPLKRTAVVT